MIDHERRRTISEDGPGWAVLDFNEKVLPGRWASEDDAYEHGMAGMYLLTGDDVKYIEPVVEPRPVEITDSQAKMLKNLKAGYPPSTGWKNAGGSATVFWSLTGKGLINGHDMTDAGHLALDTYQARTGGRR